MKKRISILATVILCTVCLISGALAAGVVKEIKAELRPDFTIEIDGEKQVFKNAQGEIVYPILYEGTTYLPVRAIGQLMGKTVYWTESSKLIELKQTTVTDADVIVESSKADNADKNPQAKPKEDVNNKVDTSRFIGEEAAKQAALKKAGLSAEGVVFKKTELDRDRDVWHYDVEFMKAGIEYEAEVSATDGKILNWEVDRYDD